MLLSRLNGAVSTNLRSWHRNVVTCGKSSVSELQCQFQGMSPVVYALQMKVGLDALCGTFPVTGKVIYAFLYYYVTDNRRYI